MPSIRRRWVTWLDGTLSLLIVACVMAMSWLAYRDGCYFEAWIWLTPILVIPPFVLGLWLLFLPWIMSPASIQWHQFWIRPALFLVIGVIVSGLWNLNLFNQPGVSSFLTGCLDSVRDKVTTNDIQALRELVAQKRRNPQMSEALHIVPVEELPASFLKSTWGPPRPASVSFHKNRFLSEIEVCWGGTLPGYFGVLIDPEQLPKEGIDESAEGRLTWHYKLSEGVYFFHTNG